MRNKKSSSRRLQKLKAGNSIQKKHVAVSSSSDEKKIEMPYDKFIDFRNKFVDQIYDQGKILDQNIFLLSTGSFGISFTFISSVVKYPNPRISYLIIISWSLLALCILLSLVSYILNHFRYKKSMESWDESYRTGVYETHSDDSGKKIELATVLNVLTISLIFVSFIFLLVYVTMSMNKVLFV